MRTKMMRRRKDKLENEPNRRKDRTVRRKTNRDGKKKTSWERNKKKGMVLIWEKYRTRTKRRKRRKGNKQGRRGTGIKESGQGRGRYERREERNNKKKTEKEEEEEGQIITRMRRGYIKRERQQGYEKGKGEGEEGQRITRTRKRTKWVERKGTRTRRMKKRKRNN